MLVTMVAAIRTTAKGRLNQVRNFHGLAALRRARLNSFFLFFISFFSSIVSSIPYTSAFFPYTQFLLLLFFTLYSGRGVSVR